MILFSGYPDTTVTFSDFARHFEDKFHVVRIAYPDLDQKKLRRYWGYSMDEVVDALAVVVREYTDSFQGKTSNDDERQTSPPIYLVGHDWGSVIVQKYLNKYPKCVRKVVLEDVGMVYPRDAPLTTLLIMGYQLYLAFLFVLSRIVGNNAPTAWFRILLVLYPWLLIGPIKTVRCTIWCLLIKVKIPTIACVCGWVGKGSEASQSSLASSVLSILSKHDHLCAGKGNTPVRVECAATVLVRWEQTFHVPLRTVSQETASRRGMFVQGIHRRGTLVARIALR